MQHDPTAMPLADARAWILRTRLKRAMRWRKLNMTQLSLEVGRDRALVKQIIAGRITKPRDRTVAALCRVLGVSTEWLTGGDVTDLVETATAYKTAAELRDALKAEPNANDAERMRARANDLDRLDGPYDDLEPSARPIPQGVEEPRAPSPFTIAEMPIYWTGEGDAETGMQFRQEVVQRVARPEPVIGVEDPFGIRLWDDLMSPRYDASDIIVVHPHKPVRPGDYVFLLLQAPLGALRVMVRKLVSRDAEHVVVEMLNPPPRKAKQQRIEAKHVMRILYVPGAWRD